MNSQQLIEEQVGENLIQNGNTGDLQPRGTQISEDLQRIGRFLDGRRALMMLAAQANLVDQHSENSEICKICCQAKPLNVFHHLCCQSHSYCRGCIVKMINEDLNNFKIIKCPEEDCLTQLNEESPYYSMLKDTQKKKIAKIYRNRKLIQNPQVKICRKQSCDGLLQITSRKVQCQLCKQKYCQKCYQILHKGPCDGQLAKRLYRKHRFRRCPNCRMMVQKNQGCDHMTCLCSYQFCYKCGESFVNGHICKPNVNRGRFAKMRLEVERANSDYNSIINCSKILDVLEPNIQSSQVSKYIYLFLLSTVLYAVINSLAIGLALAFFIIYITFALVVTIFYVVLLPLFQISNLQLPPSKYLLWKGLRKWLVRLLMVPLYLLNVFFAIKSIPKIYDCDLKIVRKAIHIITFFLLFPCLIMVDDEDLE